MNSRNNHDHYYKKGGQLIELWAKDIKWTIKQQAMDASEQQS